MSRHIAESTFYGFEGLCGFQLVGSWKEARDTLNAESFIIPKIILPGSWEDQGIINSKRKAKE